MTKMKPRIYLAGYVKEYEYRKYVAQKYGKVVTVFDPIKDIECNMSDDIQENFPVVETEKVEIANSHILVAYIRRKTIGTSMEILHAYNNNIPILIIIEDSALKNDLWLAYHATRFFMTIDDCFKLILNQFQIEFF